MATAEHDLNQEAAQRAYWRAVEETQAKVLLLKSQIVEEAGIAPTRDTFAAGYLTRFQLVLPNGAYVEGEWESGAVNAQEMALTNLLGNWRRYVAETAPAMQAVA